MTHDQDNWLVMRSHPSEASLADYLAGRGEDEIVRFWDWLVSSASQLLTTEHRKAAQQYRDKNGLPVTSEETFADLRLAVVAAGRDRWQEVIRNPDSLALPWLLEEGDRLTSAIEEAYAAATGNTFPIAVLSKLIPVDDVVPQLRSENWISIVPSTYFTHPPYKRLKLPPAYRDELRLIEGRLLKDPAWISWWSRNEGYAELEFHLLFRSSGSERLSVGENSRTPGIREVSVELSCLAPEKTLEDNLLKELAALHVKKALSRVATKLNLPPPPPFVEPSAKFAR